LECELDKTYKAVCNIDEGCFIIYFKFYYAHGMKTLWIAETGDGAHEATYILAGASEIRNTRPEGTWILTFHKDHTPTWMLKTKKGDWHTPIISDVNDENVKGKHYDYIIEDDIINNDTIDAYRYIIKNYPFDYQMKGGKDMKYLFHVIIFNTGSETIEYKAYTPAKNEQEASMLAAQNYGMYDPNKHIVIVKQIDNSCYEKK